MGYDFDPRSHDHEIERHERAGRDRSPQDPRHPADRAHPDDVFTRDLDVPRGREREVLSVSGRTYQLRDTQARALAAIGAFRAVPAGDLRDPHGSPMRVDRGDLYELRRDGLIRVV